MSAAPTNHNVRSTTGTGSSRKLWNKLVSGTAAVRIVLRLVSACTSVCSGVCCSTTVIFFTSPLGLPLHVQGSQVKKGINLKPWFKERKLLLATVRRVPVFTELPRRDILGSPEDQRHRERRAGDLTPR